MSRAEKVAVAVTMFVGVVVLAIYVTAYVRARKVISNIQRR